MKRLLAMIVAVILLVSQLNLSAYQVSGSTHETFNINEHTYFVDFSTIRHIMCGKKWLGTGEIVAPDIVFTANHVISGYKKCTDIATGEVGNVTMSNPSLDIATLRFKSGVLPSSLMQYGCDGLADGKHYYTIGWAHGDTLVMNKVDPTKMMTWKQDWNSHTQFAHVRLVHAYIIPGMSGGPIIDENGLMVGMNDATDHDGTSYVRDIADTYLCELPKDSVFINALETNFKKARIIF